jgi:hypothetical protein
MLRQMGGGSTFVCGPCTPVPRRRCVLLDDLYFCFSNFKIDFLSSDASKFN